MLPMPREVSALEWNPELTVLEFRDKAGTGQLYSRLNDSKLPIRCINLTQTVWQNAEISTTNFGVNLAKAA